MAAIKAAATAFLCIYRKLSQKKSVAFLKMPHAHEGHSTFFGPHKVDPIPQSDFFVNIIGKSIRRKNI